MRHVISVSLKEKTILELREKVRDNDIFRNKSHFIEYAIKKTIEKKNA